MNGGIKLPEIKVTLRNVKNKNDYLTYYIKPDNSCIAEDWVNALKDLLLKGNPIEKNYCFMGFPYSQRTVSYLCEKLNSYIFTINTFNQTNIWQEAGLDPYVIEEHFSEESVRFSTDYPKGPADNNDETKTLGLRLKHNMMNNLHLHFERLQGQVWNLSPYYKLANYETKFAIRQLNNLCHELENRILSDRKFEIEPEWTRPSQITTFLQAPRFELKDEHRKRFVENGYDREFGKVYMHWTQIGKTLFEVWRDEGAPDLSVGSDPTDITIGSGATSEAINSLKYYSGEFDIEWAKTIKYGQYEWYDSEMDAYHDWLKSNNIDIINPHLSLGYLPIASVDLQKSFGTQNEKEIWDIMGDYLDIYSIEINEIKQIYSDSWADDDADKKQIEFMRNGYDYSSSRG